MSDQPSSPQKICVLCGQDCAGQPRIKDPKGRYYHKACHEQAMMEREQRRAQEPAPDLAPPEESSPFPVDEPEVAATGPAHEFESVIPEATGGQGCPSCGHPVAPEAVLCTNCGYNLQTGESMGAAPLSEVAAPPSRTGEGQTWPTVIGIISIVFGGAGALVYLLPMVGALTGGADTEGTGIAVNIGGSALGLALALWLLTAGIGVLRRKQTAAVSIRRWALTKTILYCTCLAFTLGLVFLASGMISEMQDELGEGASIGTGVIVVGVLAIFAWFLAWPIFILVWFGRDTIQEQIGRWH